MKVGLTGGIGSGKSTVSERFQALGVPVIDTDVISHQLTAHGSPLLEEIDAQLGPGILDPAGNLDRGRLRAKVFLDDNARRKLENILHPAISKEVSTRVGALSSEYCVIVVPLLIETNFTQLVDRVLVIDAPEASRMSWIRKRGLGDEEIRRIMASQASSHERLKAADDVLVNDGTRDELVAKVDQLHSRYLELSKTSE